MGWWGSSEQGVGPGQPLASAHAIVWGEDNLKDKERFKLVITRWIISPVFLLSYKELY